MLITLCLLTGMALCCRINAPGEQVRVCEIAYVQNMSTDNRKKQLDKGGKDG